ncbi:MAG: cytochrome C [Myxococcota bacterium]
MATVQDFGVERAKEKKAADAAQKKAHAEEPGKGPSLANRIHTWPYLVRAEFLTGLVVMIMITVWSIVVDAPLEEPANPNRTPNPSKAPWYFLGLQEMLVYFDPWFAGVVLPSLIIVGLMVIPYIDINPRGNGYYTLKERPFAMSMFMFGFLMLWIALIALGTFLRGPGWYFFGPWQYWDPHKVVALTNVDFPYMVCKAFGLPPTAVLDDVIGAIAVLTFYPGLAVIGWPLLRRKAPEAAAQLGIVRYHIVAMLFLLMMSLPLKMILRWTLNIKYVWTCCEGLFGASLINF